MQNPHCTSAWTREDSISAASALCATPRFGQRWLSLWRWPCAQRYRLVSRGGDAINGRGEASRVDVPPDVLVECVCLVVHGGAEAGELRGLPRASWACTQLDERGRLAPLSDEGTAAARE